MRGNRNETVGRGWRGGGGLEVFAKSKNISNMDMVLILLCPHSLRIYLGYSNFIFHVIPYHFGFCINPNPNILQLILWRGKNNHVFSFMYLTWVREAEVAPWRKKNSESSCLLRKERNCQGKIALPPPFLPFLHFSPHTYLWRYNCVWDDLMNVGAEVSENRVVCSESVHFLFFKDPDWFDLLQKGKYLYT